MNLLENKKILVVGAHSDDEVLGVGGSIIKAVQSNSIVDVLIATDSVSTQYEDEKNMESKRLSSLHLCCGEMGVHNVQQWDFPDMRLDTVPHVELNKKLSQFINEGAYDVVFCHYQNDINLDHKLLFESTMVATRPTPDQTVKIVLSYYTPSATEWGGYDRSHIFTPNWFIDISDQLDQKIKALENYESELRNYPHPRSIKNVRNVAEYYGSSVGVDAAEPFMLLRAVL